VRLSVDVAVAFGLKSTRRRVKGIASHVPHLYSVGRLIPIMFDSVILYT
jgi:hypothetical protein